MKVLPGGTVTFLFTDIEGSSTLWEQNPTAMKAALDRHNAILYQAIEAHDGHVFKIVGDAFHAAFSEPSAGLLAAVEVQRLLLAEPWGETGPIRVRIGLHTGHAEHRQGDYLSSHTLNRTSRIMSAGSGGQVLLSLAVEELAREHLPQGVSLRDLGEYRLKGLRRLERIFQLVAPGLPQDFPRLNSLPVFEPDTGEGRILQERYNLLDRIIRGGMVGRDRELTLVNTVWQQTVAGEGAVLLVSGEPGIGKTRLVQEIAAHCEAFGGLVLRGECYAEGAAPYAPIAQLIYTMAERTGNLFEEHLSQVVLADLVTLAPGLRARFPEILPNPALDPASERQRLFESVVWLCNFLLEGKSLVLIIDDAHWADHGTLLLVHHLARRLRQRRALILITYREVELDEARPLYEVLLDMNRERLATRLKLGRLSREQTRDLLKLMFAEEITEELLEGIFSETEGNPFFTEEVCKALIESGKLYYADGQWHRPSMAEIEIPQSVRLAIQTRVSKLHEKTQDVLLQAAVFGREFNYESLNRACELDEEALVAALENAERAQLIQEVSGARDLTFSFAHALIPATLHESLGALRRRRLHRRAAEAIEVLSPQDYDALARHYVTAGDRLKAIANYRLAANQAVVVFAYDTASAYLTNAMNLVDHATPLEIQGQLYESLGDVEQQNGQASEAIQNYLNASGIWKSLPSFTPATEIRLHRKIIESETSIFLYTVRQRFQSATLSSREAGLELAQSEPPNSEITRLLVACSKNAWIARIPAEWDKAENFARAAVDMAERLGDPTSLSEALGALANVQGALSQFRERVDTALRRIALSRNANFTDAYERAKILEEAGEALIFVGEYDQALIFLLEAEALASQLQAVRLSTATLRYLAQCYFYLDRWDDALATEEKRRLLEQQYVNFIERAGMMCFHMALSASIYALRGEIGAAQGLRDQSLAVMEAMNGPPDAWERSNYY